jgi:hypothetical protein
MTREEVQDIREGKNKDLRGADLRWEDLRVADLSGASLSGANLSMADLRGANLRSADLRSADLREANLTRADLRNTILDNQIMSLAQQFIRETISHKGKSRLVYRTTQCQYMGSEEYIPGRTYRAEIFSHDLSTACHPGIYAGSKQWMQAHYPKERLVKCLVREGYYIPTLKGCIRCMELRVLAYEPPDEKKEKTHVQKKDPSNH